jgi:hypothetical protein
MGKRRRGIGPADTVSPRRHLSVACPLPFGWGEMVESLHDRTGWLRRRFGAAALVCTCLALGGCSSFSGYVSDHWPTWAGGMPSDVPPRPGAPGYAEFISHQGANDPAASAANANQPGGAPATAPGATGAVAAAPVATGPGGPPTVATIPVAAVPPIAQAQPAMRSTDMPAAVQGGLY